MLESNGINLDARFWSEALPLVRGQVSKSVQKITGPVMQIDKGWSRCEARRAFKHIAQYQSF
jgi:hypothetical protein